MMNFTLEYSKNNDFLRYFLFWVTKMLFSVILRIFFCFVLNFCDFSRFLPYHGKLATITFISLHLRRKILETFLMLSSVRIYAI